MEFIITVFNYVLSRDTSIYERQIEQTHYSRRLVIRTLDHCNLLATRIVLFGDQRIPCTLKALR